MVCRSSAYAATLEDGEEKRWFYDVFLPEEPTIEDRNGRQIMHPLHWEDNVFLSENGFASGMSVSRDAGGSLCPVYRQGPCPIGPPTVLFSKEKLQAYTPVECGHFVVEGRQSTLAYVYDKHNVDHYPGALFLRNWAILYLNAAIRSVGDVLFERD